MPTTTEAKPRKRVTVKRHKDAMIAAMSGREKYLLKEFVRKFYKDYRQVASKRGSRNFSVGRWLEQNIK